MAANYAAAHPERLRGVILFAAYPTKELNDSLLLLSVYGSEDGVLRPDRVEAGRAFAPKDYYEFVIEGGNHAQFGSYGPQSGDGEAQNSPAEQLRQTVEAILSSRGFFVTRQPLPASGLSPSPRPGFPAGSLPA